MNAVRRFGGAVLLVICAGAGWSAGLVLRSDGRVREVPVPALTGEIDERAGMQLAGPRAAVFAEAEPDTAAERGRVGSGWRVTGTATGRDGVPVVRIFGDYECPACQALERLAGDSLRALAAAGRIRLIYHHSPLRTHRWGAAAAETAYCALETGAGWSAHSALYRTAPEWSRAAAPDRSMVEVAVRAGADEDAIRNCIAAGRAADRARMDRDLSRWLKVNAVPTVFLDAARVEFRSFGALLHHIVERAAGS